MTRLVHPLFMLLAPATDKELVRTVEYLKTENRILRSKLPKRIEVTPAEKAKLIKLGKRLGTKIKDVITIVHPRTFARWLKESVSGIVSRRRGRPRKPEDIRLLILEMAKNTGWGYRRILGELKKLRIYNVSRSTIPDGAWMVQVARNMSMTFAEEPTEYQPTHIVRDRDAKFTAEFCSILETDGMSFVPFRPEVRI